MNVRSLSRLALACSTLIAFGFTGAAPKFEVVSGFFPAQPGAQPYGPMHGGVAVDRAGNIYASTDTPRGILEFNSKGKFLRSFGPDHIHGLFIHRERGEEFLYCARPSYHDVQKIKLDGTVVWKMGYPEKSGIYTKADEFNPTNVVAAPDGTVFVADGYGKHWIHKYDANLNYIKSFGGPDPVTPAPEGKFNTCHGITVDLRGPKPMLFVCNRESGRVEYWDMDGNFVKVLQSGLRMPACVQIKGDYAAIGELQGRVTVLDKHNDIVAEVGDNPKASQRANYGLDPKEWTEGICNSPHGISFDKDGNIIVSEWSQFGRISKFALAK